MAGAGGSSNSLQETPGWRVALIFLGFACVSLLIDWILEWLEHKFKHNKGVVYVIRAVKNELLSVGVISLLLAAFQYEIATICVDSKDSATRYLRRRLLGSAPSTSSAYSAGTSGNSSYTPASSSSKYANPCGPGQESLWSVSLMHDAHLLLFFIAITHIVYAAGTMYITMWKLRTWRQWELNAAQHGTALQPHPMHKEWLYNRFHDSRMLTALMSFLGQFTTQVTEPIYANARMLFIDRMQFSTDFDFHQLVEITMEESLVSMIKTNWVMWTIAAVFLVFPRTSYIMYWATGVTVLVLLLLGAHLVHIVVHLSLQMVLRYGDDVVFGRMDSNAAAMARRLLHSPSLGRVSLKSPRRSSQEARRSIALTPKPKTPYQRAISKSLRLTEDEPQHSAQLVRHSVPARLPDAAVQRPLSRNSLRNMLRAMHLLPTPPPCGASTDGGAFEAGGSGSVDEQHVQVCDPEQGLGAGEAEMSPTPALTRVSRPSPLQTVEEDASTRSVTRSGQPAVTTSPPGLDAGGESGPGPVGEGREEYSSAPRMASYRGIVPVLMIPGEDGESCEVLGGAGKGAAQAASQGSSAQTDMHESSHEHVVLEPAGLGHGNSSMPRKKVGFNGVPVSPRRLSLLHEPGVSPSPFMSQVAPSPVPGDANGDTLSSARGKKRRRIWGACIHQGEEDSGCCLPRNNSRQPHSSIGRSKSAAFRRGLERQREKLQAMDARDFFWFKSPYLYQKTIQYTYFENSITIALVLFALIQQQSDSWLLGPRYWYLTMILLLVDVSLGAYSAFHVLPIYSLLQLLGSHNEESVIRRAQRKGMHIEPESVASNGGALALLRNRAASMLRVRNTGSIARGAVVPHKPESPRPPGPHQGHGSGRFKSSLQMMVDTINARRKQQRQSLYHAYATAHSRDVGVQVDMGNEDVLMRCSVHQPEPQSMSDLPDSAAPARTFLHNLSSRFSRSTQMNASARAEKRNTNEGELYMQSSYRA